MTYGIKCWDKSGNITLDTTKILSRLVFYTVATAWNSGQYAFASSRFMPSDLIGFSVGISDTGGAAYWGYCNHEVNIDLEEDYTVVSWTPRSNTEFDSGDSLVLVFAKK